MDAASDTLYADGRLLALHGKQKFLLIDSRRRFQSRLHALTEPIGHVAVERNDLVKGFASMRFSLRLAIAERDHHAQRVAIRKQLPDPFFVEREGGPAGVQAELLRKEHELFAVVSTAKVKVLFLFARENDVVFYIPKAPVVGEFRIKSARIVIADKKLQTTLTTAGGRIVVKCVACLPL